MNRVMMYNGITIRVSPLIHPVPALQIDPKFQWCTDAYRAKHNAWLLERFGVVHPNYMIGGVMFMSPESYDTLVKSVKLQENGL